MSKRKQKLAPMSDTPEKKVVAVLECSPLPKNGKKSQKRSLPPAKPSQKQDKKRPSLAKEAPKPKKPKVEPGESLLKQKSEPAEVITAPNQLLHEIEKPGEEPGDPILSDKPIQISPVQLGKTPSLIKTEPELDVNEDWKDFETGLVATVSSQLFKGF